MFNVTALSLYLKYPSTFEYWYYQDEDERDRHDYSWLEGVDRDDFLANVDTIYDEAAKGFDEIRKKVSEALSKELKITIKQKRNRILFINGINWEWRIKNNRKKNFDRASLGINFDIVDDKLTAIPWIRIRGGKAGSGELEKILGDDKNSDEKKFLHINDGGWHPGSVAYNNSPFIIGPETAIDDILKSIIVFSDIGEDVWAKIIAAAYD